MPSSGIIVIRHIPLHLPNVFFSFLLVLTLVGASASCTKGDCELPGSNVLLITLDTTRWDALGCYGGPGLITPNLDRIAVDGVRFDQARTVAPVTLPAHATILTGLYPFEHGVRDNATFRLPGDVATLAERMKAKGYATFAVMGAFVLHSTFGLNQGFDIYSDVPRRRLNLGVAEDQRSASEVVDEALGLLKKAKGEAPFLMWVHFFDPHFPYQPPKSRVLEGLRRDSLSGQDLNRRQYFGEVAFMDQEIGRLIRSARTMVPRGRLLTAVVSDHGEGLGDHGEDTHAFQLYDTTVRVPMILHHAALPEGEVVSEQVSLADFAPTILALLGMEYEGMSGRDLSPLFGMGEGAPGSSVSYFEAAHPFFNYNWSPLFGMTEGSLKLIDGPNPALYDVEKDPGELKNLAARSEKEIDRMREMFSTLVSRTRKPERIELSREDRTRIEGLGYAGSTIRSVDKTPMLPGRLMEGKLDPKEGLELWKRCSNARTLSLKRSDKDRKMAVDIMEKVLDEDPGNPTFLAHAGSIYFQTKNYIEGIRVLEKSLTMLESPTSREVLATCLFNLGRIKEATALLRINADLHPNDLISRFKLSDALLRQGQAMEALRHLEFFLKEYRTKDDLYGKAEEMKRRAQRMIR